MIHHPSQKKIAGIGLATGGAFTQGGVTLLPYEVFCRASTCQRIGKPRSLKARLGPTSHAANGCAA